MLSNVQALLQKQPVIQFGYYALHAKGNDHTIWPLPCQFHLTHHLCVGSIHAYTVKTELFVADE